MQHSRIQPYPDEHRLICSVFIGADLVIADGQYTDEEYPNKVNWGHARANTLVDVCLEAGVKNLAVTHHDQCIQMTW